MEKPAITYETLFELFRREKSKEDLQKLSPEFFEEVRKYLADKKQSTFSQADSIFSESEKEKLERQLANIKKIINELYERREKKIISMALNKSRVNAVIDTSALLTKERIFFNSLFDIFNSTRKDIIDAVLNESAPARAEEEQEQKKEEQKNEADQKTRLVRFLCAVPQFVGPDLDVYGPFEEDDVATLPEDVCTVLVNKSRAEEIEEG